MDEWPGPPPQRHPGESSLGGPPGAPGLEEFRGQRKSASLPCPATTLRCRAQRGEGGEHRPGPLLGPGQQAPSANHPQAGRLGAVRWGEGALWSQGLAGRGRGSPESACAPSQVPTFPPPGVGGTQGPWSRGGSTGAAETASPLTPLPALRAPLPWSPGPVGAAVRTGPLNTCTYRGDAACGGVTITAGCWGGHTGCPSLPEPPPPPGCRR